MKRQHDLEVNTINNLAAKNEEELQRMKQQMNSMDEEHKEQLRLEKIEMDRKQREWEEAELRKNAIAKTNYLKWKRQCKKQNWNMIIWWFKQKNKASKKQRAELKKQAEALKRQKEIHDEKQRQLEIERKKEKEKHEMELQKRERDYNATRATIQTRSRATKEAC